MRKENLKIENLNRHELRGIESDINEYHASEQVLIRMKEYLGQVLDMTVDGFLVLNGKGDIIFTNNSYCKMSGYTSDELKRMAINDLEAFEGHSEIRLRMGHVKDNARELFEMRHRRKEGGVYNVEISLSYIRDLDIFISYCRDITDRKKADDILKHAERSLRESEEKARAILNSSPAAIVLLDRDGIVLDCNNRFPALFKMTREEIIGTCIWDRFSSREKDYRRIQIEHIFYTGESCILEDKRGDAWYEFRLEPAIRGVQDEVNAVLLEVLNINDRKQAEEERTRLEIQLQHAQRMDSIGRLAGGVAHDFNNMLSVIMGNAELAINTINHDEPIYERLSDIKEAAERSADLTRQLLAFARKQAIMPRVIDLNATIESMLKLLRRIIGEDIKLMWKPGNCICAINMDPSQLDQILANLCINARDAIKGVGNVTIETHAATFDKSCFSGNFRIMPGEYVMLEVGDDGCGMDQDTLKKIFEPFFTTKEPGKGTGLGLATVYGIVKQNEGYITVHSKQGEGTVFKIYLPRYQGDLEKVQTGQIRESRGCGKETILLVDDDAGILKSISKTLGNLGYQVLTSSKPSEAICLIKTCGAPVNLLITDVIMPEMNGYSLAKDLLAINPNIRSLFMSGYSDDVIDPACVLGKDINLIRKPFTTSELAFKVRDILKVN